MFENIGRKIKVLAQVVFWVGVIGSCIAGIVVLAEMESPIGLLIMFGGSVSALISSWLAYGFGELIDKTTEVAQNTKTLHTIQMAVEQKCKTDVGDNPKTKGNTSKVASETNATEQPKNNSDVHVSSQQPSLEKWLAEGIISEEEYLKIKAIKK